MCIFVILTTPISTEVLLADQQDFEQRKEQQLRSHDFDVKHYRIALSLNESERSFVGETVITFSSVIDGLRKLKLDAETFTVQSVTDNGKALRFNHEKGSLVVSLNRALVKNEEATLIIGYVAKNINIDSTRFGMMEGYDLGLDFEPKSKTNPQLINSLNFPEGARHWFPSFDHPSDWATHETIITVKDAYQVLANGMLVSDIADGNTGHRTVHWRQDKPQPTYLYVFVAGPHSVLKDKHGELPLHYWVYPGDETVGKQSFSATAGMIAFFEDLYGIKFPWVKYDQIIIPGVGGGAESTSATLLGERVITYERDGEKGASDWLLAHEIAHQWWGDMIGYKDWQHVWLSESFATHGEHLYIKHAYGDDEGALYLHEYKVSYFDEAHNEFVRPIVTKKWNKPNEMFDHHAYEKGGIVLNMFREIVGHETFGDILQSFLKTHAYSNATTSDFYDAVKTVTKKDYSWFFEQWLVRPGHPVLEVSYRWDSRQNSLSMTIEQTQATSNGIPIFRLPVKVGITTKSVKKVESIWLEEQKQTFTFEVSEKPLMVHFDEEDILLMEWSIDKSTEELLYQAAHDEAMGRIRAIGELGKRHSEKGVPEHLLKLALNDGFWAVREKALQMLPANHKTNFVNEIKSVAQGDSHDRVRAAAFKALGEYDDTGLAPFFLERYQNEQSYSAKTAIITALGRYRDPAYEVLFKEALLTPTKRRALKEVAQTALDALSDQQPSNKPD